MSGTPLHSSPPVARPPKRERGRQRVEALLDAAAGVFLERGADAATMTEIAVRAGASIGSLYQFFPNKSLLAQALRDRFVVRVLAVFDRLEREPAMEPAALTKALVNYIRAFEQDRAVMRTLGDVANEHDADRVRTRSILTQALGRVLCAHAPGLDHRRAVLSARLILYLLRLVSELPYETDSMGMGNELESLIQTYLLSLGTGGKSRGT